MFDRKPLPQSRAVVNIFIFVFPYRVLGKGAILEKTKKNVLADPLKLKVRDSNTLPSLFCKLFHIFQK